MKLSKKIGIIYIISLIISSILCFFFYTGFTNGATKGEKLRSVEISNGVLHSLNKLTNKSQENIYFFKELVEINYSKNNQYPILNYENTFFKNPFLFNLNTKSFLQLEKNSKSPTEEILEKLSEIIKKNPSLPTSGLMLINNETYLISYATIDLPKFDYIVLTHKFDSTIHEYIGASTNSETNLIYDLSDIFNELYNFEIYGENHLFKESKSKISTYMPLTTLDNFNGLYLEVLQNKNVQDIITNNFLIFMSLLFLLFFGINFFIYILFQKIVINRITKLSNNLNFINEANPNLNILPNENYKDEISELSNSIKKMLKKISCSTKELKRNELKYSRTLKTMTNSFLYCKSIYNENNKLIDGEILELNQSAKTFLNLNNLNNDLLSNFIPEELNSKLLSQLNNNTTAFSHEIQFSNNKWASFSANIVDDGYFFVVINDITKIKNYSEEMHYLATFDSLTSIFNRRKLIEYTNKLIKNKESFSLYFIDLDNFKKVNDTIGHDYGDALLIEVSKSLNKLASKTIKIGRFGGDEFVIIKKGNLKENEIKDFSKLIFNTISKDYLLNNFNFKLYASIGISCYPIDGLNSSTIIKHADIAMYNSKINSGNQATIFSKSLLSDYALEDKLSQALKNNELITYYQPIYNINKKEIDTVESLIRWEHQGNLISPNNFIPLAKRNGFIIDIDKKVFLDSCILNRDFKKIHNKYLTISINISYSFLIQPNFTDYILSIAKKYNIPTKFIKLEITEDEILEDIGYVISILNNLRANGFLIALDDFGVGYSSFNYIKRLPLDTIKIDRSLISSIENDKKALSIIKTLISLSKSLDLEVVCEGIEDKKQFILLEALGCDKIQGFFFSKPLDKNKLYKYLENFKNP
ncbi:MAG: EAL domain-containing protein [Sarcina sp.]